MEGVSPIPDVWASPWSGSRGPAKQRRSMAQSHPRTCSLRSADSERREISKNLRGKAGPDRRASLARWLAPTRTLSERGELAGSFRLQGLYGPLAGHDLSSYGILSTYRTNPAVPGGFGGGGPGAEP